VQARNQALDDAEDDEHEKRANQAAAKTGGHAPGRPRALPDGAFVIG
jgi:hypothetical protein